METRRVLVIANQTAGGTALRDEIDRRVKLGKHTFTLIVPATPPQDHALWTDGEATEIAQDNLERALHALRAQGAEITGVVGDASPVLAIEDAMQRAEYDEIILSTLPPGPSRWLKQGLPDRIKRRFDLPLTVIIGQPEPVRAP